MQDKAAETPATQPAQPSITVEQPPPAIPTTSEPETLSTLSTLVEQMRAPEEPQSELPQPVQQGLEALQNADAADPTAFQTALVEAIPAFNDYLQQRLSQNPELAAQFSTLKEQIQSGQLTPQQVLASLQEIAGQIPQEHPQTSQEALTELEEEFVKPPEQRNSNKIEAALKKLLNALKIVGIIVIALVGIGTFQGFVGGNRE